MISMLEHLSTLTAEVLRDLGRNESADWSWRKGAVAILMDKKHPFAYHPDLKEIRREIEEELEAYHEVESLVAQTVEEPSVKREVVPDAKEETPGPFKASFTTKDM